MYNKVYFCMSDIHSFYDEMMDALNKAGFDPSNKRHVLLIIGDIFDRGKKPLEIYNFLKSLPRDQRILIRGNHESLLKELVSKNFPESHDFHNGTVDTLYYLNGMLDSRQYKTWINGRIEKPINELKKKYGKIDESNFMEFYEEKSKIVNKFSAASVKRFRKAAHSKIVKEIIEWIDSDEWVDYYELDKYIFVHSFIPLKTEWKHYNQYGYLSDVEKSYDPTWRTFSREDFEEASWGCPYRSFLDGYFNEELKNGKVLVCGHWHAFDFKNHFEGTDYDFDTYDPKDIDWDIFYSNHLIALDACTVVSHQVNVMLIDDESWQCHNSDGILMCEKLSKDGKLLFWKLYPEYNSDDIEEFIRRTYEKEE